MSKNHEKWYITVANIFTHAIVGLAYFAAMALPAVLIFKTNEWLTEIGVKGMTMSMLYGAEAVLLLFDFYAICRYIYISVREDHKE